MLITVYVYPIRTFSLLVKKMQVQGIKAMRQVLMIGFDQALLL